jgi:guanylate kinase
MNTAPTGRLVVVAGPSGAGKSTLLRRLLAECPRYAFAVSCTTRPPRPGEEQGREYYFLGEEEFERRVRAGEFAEWEALHARRYGTLKSEIETLRAAGRQVLFDVDVHGALRLKALYPEALLVFIAPPSLAVLEERLRARRSESEEQIAIRLERSRLELELAGRFDCRVVNDDLESSYRDLLACLGEPSKEESVHAQPA